MYDFYSVQLGIVLHACVQTDHGPQPQSHQSLLKTTRAISLARILTSLALLQDAFAVFWKSMNALRRLAYPGVVKTDMKGSVSMSKALSSRLNNRILSSALRFGKMIWSGKRPVRDFDVIKLFILISSPASTTIMFPELFCRNCRISSIASR